MGGVPTVAERRYATEMGFHSVCSTLIMLQQGELESVASSRIVQEERLHIYLIGQRPRTTFDPKAFRLEPPLLHGRLNVQHQDSFDRASFSVPFNFDIDGLQIECSYPYSELRLINRTTAEVEFRTKASILATT